MAYELHKITILVVEDNQAMLEIVKALLLTFGIGNVVGAKDGQDGYELFKRYDPDLIIADWLMKPMDGISFTKLVRNAPDSPNPFVPIILMTGFSEKRRVIEARDVGVTEFLVKPFNAHDLYRRLVQIIERPRQFIRSINFFGPDRRRKRIENYQGPKRREIDIPEMPTPAQQKYKRKQAHEVLRDMRKKTGLGKGDKIDLEDIRHVK